MRTLSRKFFAIGLLLALLVCSTSRAIPVSALAQPDWSLNAEYAPIFDTEIINIEDYMGSSLTGSQLDVFWILLGVYVCAQGGSEEYKLRNPYANESGVVNWLKDCGIQLWNAMVGLNITPIDPVTGVDWRVVAKKAQDIAFGAAVKASTYQDVDDFLSDVETKEKYLVPFMPDIQTALNYVFSQKNGLYDWQFEQTDFRTNLVHNQVFLPPTSNYWTLLASFHDPIVRANDAGYENLVTNCTFFDTYRNLFFNTTDGKYYFCDDSGSYYPSGHGYMSTSVRWLYKFGSVIEAINTRIDIVYSESYLQTYNSWQDLVQYYIDNPSVMFNNRVYFINDFVQHYYYGASWETKHEIFNTTDLNFDENTLPYFNQVTNNNLLDIKGILHDLVNTTDLWDVFINNLYDLNGVIVTDPQLIHVTKDILYEIQTQNIPLPVNLNDIADYTDNSYMDRVKEDAQRGGNALAALVAFWHNCDADLIYVLFGAGITVLVGAFIGKWGHS